ALGQDDDARTDLTDRPPDGPGEVKGVGDDGQVGEMFAGLSEAGVGRRGDYNLPIRMSFAERPDDLAKQMNLTDTDAVEPDGRTTVDGDWLGRSEDLFAEVTAIPTGADGPDQQPGRDKHEQDEIDEVQQERRQLGLPRRGDSGRRSVETAGRRSGAPSPPYIAYEIDQPGKLVPRIDVALDDVEGEIVEAAKAPDRDREQDRGLKRRAFNQKQRGSEQAEDEEEGAFDVEPGGAGDVPHWNSDFKTAI